MLYMRFVNVIDIDDNHHHRQCEDHHCLATTTDIVFITEWMKELKHYAQYIVCSSSSSSPLFHQILRVGKLRETHIPTPVFLCILILDNNGKDKVIRFVKMAFVRKREYGKTAMENVTFHIELKDKSCSKLRWKRSHDFLFISPQISQVLDSEYKYATYFYYFLLQMHLEKKLYGKASILHGSVVAFTFTPF